MNRLVREHLPATYFAEYQLLRTELIGILTDVDLAFRPGPGLPTLGALCREIGETQHSYVEGLRTFRQDFGWRTTDPEVDRSVRALAGWYEALDRDLMSAVESLTDEQIATRRIERSDFDIVGFAPLPAQELDVYREALLIFYGKASVYLRAMGRELPGHWPAWIG